LNGIGLLILTKHSSPRLSSWQGVQCIQIIISYPSLMFQSTHTKNHFHGQNCSVIIRNYNMLIKARNRDRKEWAAITV